MKIAYVAGPYRSKYGLPGVIINIIRAWRIARKLWRMGYCVICPHANSALMSAKDIPETRFLEGDILLMLQCHVVVLAPGWWDSSGAMEEIRIATEAGIPVYSWSQDGADKLSYIKRWRDDNDHDNRSGRTD